MYFPTTRSLLKRNFTKMRFADHALYWILPLLSSVVFICCYYLGCPLLQDIIAPAENREFGLLENIAHLILLLITIIVARLTFSKVQLTLRLVFIFLFVGFAFIFLEEIDYGFHWIELFSGTPGHERAVVRNFHNRGGGTLDIIKAVGHCLIAVVFVIAPVFFTFLKKKDFWFAVLIPSSRMIFTVFAIVLTGWFSEQVESFGYLTNNSLAGNRAEFDELVIYYAFLIYILEIKRGIKESLAQSTENGQETTGYSVYRAN